MNSTISCRSSPISKLGKYSSMFFYPTVAFLLLLVPSFIGIELVAASRYSFWQEFILSLSALAAILLASFLLVMSRKCYLMETRHISINSYGFVLEGKHKKQYGWSEIAGIGLIMYAANASKQNYQLQICIFLEPVRNDVLRRLRDSYLYGALGCDKYILMDYNETYLNLIAKQSHVQVDDLRPLQMKL